MPLFADHGIGFPIPDAAAQVDYFRAFLNGNFILDLTTPLDTAIARAPFLLTSQVGVKVAIAALIGIDMLIKPFGTDARFTIGLQVTNDLFWVPILADHLFTSSPYRNQNTGAGNGGFVTAVHKPDDAPALVDIRTYLCFT